MHLFAMQIWREQTFMVRGSWEQTFMVRTWKAHFYRIQPGWMAAYEVKQISRNDGLLRCWPISIRAMAETSRWWEIGAECARALLDERLISMRA